MLLRPADIAAGAPLQGNGRVELAERTGLEPATSGVTGQHSNQLNYRSALLTFVSRALAGFGENKAPDCSGAFLKLAERTGLEPATSGVTGQHSNQLNYRSTFQNCLLMALRGGC
ncbi:hypothetical protein STPYR_10084 [uncultured Stenotrophomonas sp.]|uniref:Uncharacterized protein n=1 Tax=uncultured Stenotrophomonas sp. TaxID=165438 RepID=A0A1Y5Q6N7_9GAMM|nr:hypothetical protein STPYR_10084 [uncultured Stenotrophomonas sp.]